MALVTALRRLVRLREFAWRTASSHLWILAEDSELFLGTPPQVRQQGDGAFFNRDGEKITVKGSPGDSLLDIETLACSTCHLIFEEETYKSLGPVTDEEMDMLDLSLRPVLTPRRILFSAHRSRLGCQICLTKRMEGMVARVPESVADIRQSQDGS
ncbi:hypothetical protein KUCAC02_027811 [Chaenocephalus aceratus]|nr:hypothetical protein KUCAC02_027811 [Chaenocephalus aceratus]